MTQYQANVGEICWLDLSVPDLESAKSLMDFYQAVFNWEFSPAEPQIDDYFIARVEGKPIVGLAIIPNKPSVWVPYFRTDDINELIAKIREEHGVDIWGPESASEAARLALCLDATGAVFGLFEPQSFTGFGLTGEPVSPSWFNLTSAHIDKSVAFYKKALSLSIDAMPGAGYTVSSGRSPFATIMPDNGDQDDRVGFNHPGDYWSWFAAISSTANVCSKVRATGGEVLAEGNPTPFGLLSAILDPVARVKIYLLEPIPEENT